jgi:hypothetical protein
MVDAHDTQNSWTAGRTAVEAHTTCAPAVPDARKVPNAASAEQCVTPALDAEKGLLWAGRTNGIHRRW